MKVRINISVVRGGCTSSVPSLGELHIGEDDFSVDYYLSGDECTLHVRGGTVRQRHRGGTDIDMLFKEGEQTECLLRESGKVLTLPVFTRSLGVSLTDEGCTVSLSYVFGGEEAELVFVADAC